MSTKPISGSVYTNSDHNVNERNVQPERNQ